MSVIPRKFRMIRFIAECPQCGATYVWINQDVRRRQAKCKHCSFESESSDWPIEECNEIFVTVTEDGVTVEDE